MRGIILSILYCLTALLSLAAQPGGKSAVSCPVVKVEAERLPDLNVPRGGHSILLVNGEPTVIGGHTTNYVPTATIEYFKDGKWNLLPSAFTHDNGCAVELSTGKVLIFGGHEKNLGVGQTFEAEFYDPKTRECEGFASIDTKRALASVMAMDDGRAIIAGNWYHDDAIEMYDGKGGFIPVKAASCGRAAPCILRTAKDNAIIFTGLDTKGHHTPHPIIDRLHGEAYREPLLDEWGLLECYTYSPASAFIGDETTGDYSYLLTVANEQGQMAIARITNGQFSLLPTDIPVPMTCKQEKIFYYATIYADRQHRRAYLLGCDSDRRCHHPKPEATRVYVLTIDYAMVPAHLTLGYADAHDDLDLSFALMTADGNLMIVGGMPAQSNFKPTASTWLLHVSPRPQAAGMGFPLWGWTLLALVIAAMAIGLTWWLYRRMKNKPMIETETPTVPLNKEIQEAPDAGMDYTELMHRICQLMEQQQLFMNPNLKITDLVTALGTNRSAISACINSQRDCTFPQFVNTYRVARAQELLRNEPDIKIAEVWVKAGFSSEASFYRIFKAFTGTTPIAWKAEVH